MATPVRTQNMKKERKKKKREREREREKRKGNVFFIVLIQIYIN